MISVKIPRPIIYFLIIFLIVSVIYLIYPKYQVINSSGHIYKINKITGQVTRVKIPPSIPKFPISSKKTKIKVDPNSETGKFLKSLE